ncbi:Myc-type basic helix-loop-helix (bHLH) domain [Trinorchestia longiramus]|nr:Myc-type basic helix-loop-helix (bHLH) domain [Trinorchestia longiramus]
MSIVGGFSMPQNFNHHLSASPASLYPHHGYYGHTSPSNQLYHGWGYPAINHHNHNSYGTSGGTVSMGTNGYCGQDMPMEYSPSSMDRGTGLMTGLMNGGPVTGMMDYHHHHLHHHHDYIEVVDACGRVVKRRSSANKKERRRTQSINNAFAELRDCIPNVPPDTKLSKIKTLRLATSYIDYLMALLHSPSASSASSSSSSSSLSSSSNSITTTPPTTPPTSSNVRHLPIVPTTGTTTTATSPPPQTNVENMPIQHLPQDRLQQQQQQQIPGAGNNYLADYPSRLSFTSDGSIGCLSGDVSDEQRQQSLLCLKNSSDGDGSASKKCRTGWPEAVWANELKKEK